MDRYRPRAVSKCEWSAQDFRIVIVAILVLTVGVPTAIAQTEANLPCRLVSWWPLDGDSADVGGSNMGSVGTLSGSSPGTYVGGIVGKGWKGSPGSVVVIPHNVSLNLSSHSGFTIELWLRIDAFNNSNMLVVWKGIKATDVTSPYYLSVRGTNLNAGPGAPGTVYFSISNGTNTQFIASNIPLPLSVFKHVAVTANGSHLAIYIDGQLAVAQPVPQQFTPTSSSASLQIGGSIAAPSSYFNGVIDEVAIFSRALDPTPRSEIAAIYHAASAGKCRLKKP
jgi:Concanavalin A-like lectin/glucanases superfamily